MIKATLGGVVRGGGGVDDVLVKAKVLRWELLLGVHNGQTWLEGGKSIQLAETPDGALAFGGDITLQAPEAALESDPNPNPNPEPSPNLTLTLSLSLSLSLSRSPRLSRRLFRLLLTIGALWSSSCGCS